MQLRPLVRASVKNEAVAEVALGIDGIIAQMMAQTLAQLADVALDHVFIDVLAEEAIDGIEDLRLVQAATEVADKIFKNAPLPAGELQRLTPDLGIAAIEI